MIKRELFYYSIIVLLIFFSIFTSSNLGYSWDEFYHFINGALRWKFIESFGSFKDYYFRDNKYYPGFYDTFSYAIGAQLNKYFNLNTEVINHSINYFFSFFSLVGIFQILKKFFNKEIALISVVFCFINPFFFGHMAINGKDTIISFSFIWFHYAIIKYFLNFQNSRFKYLILASLFLGLGMGVRVAFFILILPTLIIFVFWLAKNQKENFKIFIKKIFLEILIFFSLSIFIVISCWPHLFDHNIISFLKDLIVNIIIWPGAIPTGIINGISYETSETPRLYFFYFFIYRMPIFFIVLFIIGIYLLIDKKAFINENIFNIDKKFNFVLVIFLFPILLSALLQTKLYDGIRLFLFLIPIFSFICAIAFYFIINKFRKKFLSIFFLIFLFIFFISFSYRFISIAPYQYSYVNNFFSLKESHNKFENDYWGTSFKELILKVSKLKDLEKNKLKITVCGGNVKIVAHYLNEYMNIKTIYKKNIANYIIMTNRAEGSTTCFNKFSGEDLASVERSGMILSVFRKINLSN